MAKLVAKQYANWDRNDPDFPFFRTFDPWAGRSYASGSGSANGGNQESSSEAMQSWSGLFLLGVMLQDKDMTAAGAMGWTIEESSVEEYWFDYYGWKDGPAAGNFPPSYGHAISANAYDAGDAYGTFFGGQPHYIYGIQWLPLETGLYYLGRDPKFSQHMLDSMFADEQPKNPGFNMSKLGSDWGDSTLGFEQFFDPESVVTQMDDMWTANDPVAKSMNTAGLTYYFAHSDRQLGPVAWAYHSDLPASLVYQKPGDKNLTLVAWNESETPFVCHVYQGDQVVGQVTVPSRQLSALPIPLPTTP
jgi:endoglucanase Acf2